MEQDKVYLRSLLAPRPQDAIILPPSTFLVPSEYLPSTILVPAVDSILHDVRNSPCLGTEL